MAVAAASRGVSAKLALREIRIHLCQRSPGSQGVRDFIEKRYVELKKANPDLPILIRECSDVQPKLWARYEQVSDMGEEMLVNSLQCKSFHVWKDRHYLGSADPAFGQEKNVSLNNFSADQVTRALENVLSGKA
ncbi:NADH:ubiquinone oxidoreductase subunit A2 [Rhinolophus ferrumequinum]|uniref:NADH dehydrogenase [ubiquinone] 1 alpha subcomplex subunit 2 n=1 Tax=Rhinolophus ferrumequinum TaxID=59479 RepID=A0A7J7RXY0_RHIFE|nr:NADH:ubiquinone oxidoreductase subunit A2 [Rhinolophus ferrumequinum]